MVGNIPTVTRPTSVSAPVAYFHTEPAGVPWAIGGPEGGHMSVHPNLGTLDDFDEIKVATAYEHNGQEITSFPADLTVLDFDAQPRRPVFEPPAVEPEPFLPVPTSFTARHLWFAVWLAWFLAFIGLRERSRRR